MLTKGELEFYERMPETVQQLAEEVKKLRDAVEKCTGRPVQAEDKTPVKLDQPKDFDVLAVTKVDVFPFKGAALGNVRGMARIVINDQLQIRGLRIMDGENGLFVSYPVDPFYKGDDFRTVCNPVTRKLREHIEGVVLEAYQAATK